MTNEDFMREAIRLAVENVETGVGGPFAALVVKDGTVLAAGTNRVTSTNDPTAHAEIVAIREACKTLGSFQLEGCDIYTTCEPCPMCLGAMYWARPRRVYYGSAKDDAARTGFDDSFIYEQLKTPVGQRTIPMKQILPNDSLAPFTAWTQKSDKRLY